MERKPWIGGNFKCNGSLSFLKSHCEVLNESKHCPSKIDVCIFPNTLHMFYVRDQLKNSFITGSQNISATEDGAYTGETSATILKDAGFTWTLIGHSERRQLYGETDEVIAKKVLTAQKHKEIYSVICVGETIAERKAEKTADVLTKQIKAVLPSISDFDRVVIAYEPVWAIGTGYVATPQQAQEAHQVIRNLIKESVSEKVASSVRIVYGGSVTNLNCTELFKKPDIDGFLVGGCSLKPQFLEVIASAI